MDLYSPRKLKFKAWDKESKLLMRLDSIPCVKGELHKTNHILLQFTGLKDKHQEDLYEMDIVLLNSEKFLIQWGGERSGWCLAKLSDISILEALVNENTGKMVRLCSYFESGDR